MDKPTLLTLHKKSRHPLLQDIRRRDDGRILEVTPVNRALLPYKIHKLMRETYQSRLIHHSCHTGQFMDEPSKAANRVLIGTGLGLILVCGFAIIEQRMVLDELGVGHIFLLAGIVFLILSRLVNYQTSVLGQYFPNETEEAMKTRIHDDLSQAERENKVGNAWAELESKVLTSEIAQEAEQILCEYSRILCPTTG